MKKFISVFLLIFFIFSSSLLVLAQQPESTPPTEIPEGYVFYQYQYAFLDISLIFPENWINYSSQERGILIYTPDSRGSIMLLGTPLFGEERALEEVWLKNMENLKLAGAVFQESVPDTLSGYPAIKALHTIKIGQETFQYIRYSSIIGDLFYTFSFHAPINDFEKYLGDVLKIVPSIQINIPG